MTNTTNNDETEVSSDSPSPASQSGSEGSDGATEYNTTGASAATQAGFDKAKSLAEKAQAESGRLLNKRFVLEDVLGRGGMGVVYKARDLRKVEASDSNPYVAAKVLGQSFKDHPQAFVSLQQEAVKSQKLAHPNIVTVHDFDRDGSTIFMTMELLKGDPLDSLLKLEAPFSKEIALRYFSELCSGLEYAHKRGLIHSDFKPANIFVTTGGTVKILDFGIARAASRDSLSSDFDAGDLGALTPAYATIEMINREAPSFSDDVYALACVLYYMLAGNHPYDRLSAADALDKKLKPKRIESLTKKEWQALSRALDPQKSKRPSSVEEFRRELLPEERSGGLKIAIIVTLLVLLGGGWFVFREYQNDSEAKALIQGKLEAAKECFYSQQYNCALDNAKVVVSLSPNNTEAQDIMNAARLEQDKRQFSQQVDGLLDQARTCLDKSDYSCARVKVEEVLGIDAENAQAQLIAGEIARASLEQAIATYLKRAGNCLEDGDVVCAEQALDDALAKGARPADLYDVRQQVNAAIDAQRSAAQRRTQTISTTLEAARICLRSAKYSCALTNAEKVLTLDSSNADAIELQQSVKVARAQQKANEKTASRFMREAEACYKSKNYSCAIAKSESVLAILPSEPSAIKMKKRALSSQNNAKKNISIE